MRSMVYGFLRRVLFRPAKRLESLRKFRRNRRGDDDLTLPELQALLSQYRDYVDTLAPVLRYRQAHFEARGSLAPGAGIPTARAWLREDNGISYEDKLVGTLELATAKG